MNATEQRANERLAQEIIQRRELDGRRFEPGTFVAIAEGRVVGVARTFGDADAQLVKAGAKLGEGMVCEITDSMVDVIRCENYLCP